MNHLLYISIAFVLMVIAGVYFMLPEEPITPFNAPPQEPELYIPVIYDHPPKG